MRTLMGIAILSHIVAALAFFLLGATLLVFRRGKPQRSILAVACLTTAVWAIVFVPYSILPEQWAVAAVVTEVLRNVAWTFFLLMLLGFFQPRSGRLQVAGIGIDKTVLAIGAFYCIDLMVSVSAFWQYGYPVSANSFIVSMSSRVASSVLGILLIEQLYRNTHVEKRWGIKFACLGIGGLFAYDFYMYSNAMLFRHINPSVWAARGMVNALTVPLIAISAWRTPGWSIGVTVSRRMLFHSAALTGAAIYLLLMASAGYYVRIIGGNWGAVMQIAFLFGAVTLLIGILFSGACRSWLRVFISKHFYRYNYDYRDEWLNFTRSLSQEGAGLGERVVKALANLVESPGGTAILIGESGSCETVARWNMALNSDFDPANAALCRFLEQKQWVIDLREYRADPGRYDGIAMPAWLADCPQAWLVIPLHLHRKLWGFTVLEQPRSKINLNWEVIDLLKVAGSQAASYLAQQQSTNDLMVARQFESFNRMSTFVVHDIKNLVSQLSLMMANAQRHKDNPEFQQDMIETVGYSIQKMKLMLQKLSHKDPAGGRVALDLDALLRQAIASKSGIAPKPLLSVVDGGLRVEANWERLERVVGHLIQNAIEASPRDGKVMVTLTRDGSSAGIAIADSGQGMSEEFIRERLFRPFESTKSAGMGIGVFESREYIQELGGRLVVQSQEAIGTTFRISLPLIKNIASTGDDSHEIQHQILHKILQEEKSDAK